MYRGSWHIRYRKRVLTLCSLLGWTRECARWNARVIAHRMVDSGFENHNSIGCFVCHDFPLMATPRTKWERNFVLKPRMVMAVGSFRTSHPTASAHALTFMESKWNVWIAASRSRKCRWPATSRGILIFCRSHRRRTQRSTSVATH